MLHELCHVFLPPTEQQVCCVALKPSAQHEDWRVLPARVIFVVAVVLVVMFVVVVVMFVDVVDVVVAVLLLSNYELWLDNPLKVNG